MTSRHSDATSKIFSVGLASMLLFFVMPGLAQRGYERTIVKESWPDEPVKIHKLKVKDRNVELGRKFLEGDDWLKGFTVGVKNTSAKVISYVEIELSFPRPDGGNSEQTPVYLYRLFYGRHPSSDTTPDPERRSRLPPGESVDVKLPEGEHDHIKTVLERLGYPDKVLSAAVSVGAVAFEDGTMWSAGEILHRDPNDPQKWKAPRPPSSGSSTPTTTTPRSRSIKVGLRGLSFNAENTILWRSKPPSAKFIIQTTDTCTTVWDGTRQANCATTGCKVRQDDFLDGIEYLGMRNRKKRATFEDCFRSDGSRCHADFGTTNSRPAPCGRVLAEECIANGWNWDSTTNTCSETCSPWAEGQASCEQGVQIWCERRCECSTPTQCESSPIIIDVAGDGFDLTDAAGGVTFDLDSDGVRERLSWTSAGSDDAWLALDRDGNGRVDNGRELFGNFTEQPPSSEPNGFLALARYDKPERGGDGDGVIDASDSVFTSLRLWRDADHDGLSEGGELHPLGGLGLTSVALDYRESRREDANGNRFRYRAKVGEARGSRLGRWAWDVFLVSGQ